LTKKLLEDPANYEIIDLEKATKTNEAKNLQMAYATNQVK
jgi:hypothetical protein